MVAPRPHRCRRPANRKRAEAENLCGVSPLHVEPLLRRVLASGDNFTASDLEDGLDEAGRLTLLQCLVREGLRNDAIARRLFIAPGTVKVHLSHIFAKLGITTRAELAAQAASQDLTAR